MTAPCFIGVICGFKSEAAAIRAASPAGRVRVAVSGADPMRAETLARELCRDGAAAILSVGVSGGLAPHLAPGDLIIGEAVRTRTGEEFESNSALLAALELESAALEMEVVTLFGADAIVASARAKAELFSRYGASAVDMESHGAARAARAAGLPYAAIRAIADPASRALPPAALNAVAPDGSTRALAVLLQCARAPDQLPALIKLGMDSNAALATLRGSLGGLFGRLFLSLNL